MDPLAEFFAVASVLYHATSGHLPVQTKRNIAEERLEYLRDASLTIPTTPLRELRLDCPPTFEHALGWALSRNRAARPDSIRAFLERLQESFDKDYVFNKASCINFDIFHHFRLCHSRLPGPVNVRFVQELA